MVIIGCFEVEIYLHSPSISNVSFLSFFFNASELKKLKKELSRLVGPQNTDLPLLWGFVRDAGDFTGGIYRTGGAEAAHKSCQLSVRFSATIPLVVQKPKVARVHALTFEMGDDHYQYIEKCR
jgi:hypothetical protein